MWQIIGISHHSSYAIVGPHSLTYARAIIIANISISGVSKVDFLHYIIDSRLCDHREISRED